MRRSFIAYGAFCIALNVAPALGADLPTAPIIPAPGYSWTGFYIGAYGGGSLGGEYHLSSPVVPGFKSDLSVGGFVAGGTVGFNFQLPDSGFVFGLEGDGGFADLKNEASIHVQGGGSAHGEIRTNWLATARGRVGYAWDRVLFYGTGGAAFTEIEVKGHATGIGSESDSKTNVGWTAGGGIEAAIWENVSLKAEYQFVQFGKENYVHVNGVGNLVRADLEAHILKAGLNYRF